MQHCLNPMQMLPNLNSPAVILAQEGEDITAAPESCFAVVPKHRKYKVYMYQNDCAGTTGLLLSRHSQLELLLTECFENRSFIWTST